MCGSDFQRRCQIKILTGAIIGGLFGFVLGYLGKCSSGACPLTSNPIISTIVGALVGAMITLAK
ncbi:MAG: DUF6132 family protein [Candidatus Omnitrophica bacterium]|nr:DUF6132 family protein [Candidatus Omnitrophota bacterium]MCM8791001.1 DUF6132 family protein [Candidatus Omnitrophota bacterium]